MKKCAIFIDGPIGVGKTSLGRELASRLSFGFIDGDDHSIPGQPWLRSILRTTRSIAETGCRICSDKSGVVVAYPLRCTNWLFYKRYLNDRGIDAYCIGLQAATDAIMRRARVLHPEERERSIEMMKQGYGDRPFSDLVFRTDEADFAVTSDRLEAAVRDLMQARPHTAVPPTVT